MAMELQQCSISNQEDVIRGYAEKRGYCIVRTYADEGKSDSSVVGRVELRQLISDVRDGLQRDMLEKRCFQADFTPEIR